MDHNKLWKILKEMGIPNHLTCLLRNLYTGQQLGPDMEQWTGSKLGKEYVKAVYYHPVYLTYIQSESGSRSVVSNSHPYMTTGKTIALTRRTFVGKVSVSAFEYTI